MNQVWGLIVVTKSIPTWSSEAGRNTLRWKKVGNLVRIFGGTHGEQQQDWQCGCRSFNRDIWSRGAKVGAGCCISYFKESGRWCYRQHFTRPSKCFSSYAGHRELDQSRCDAISADDRGEVAETTTAGALANAKQKAAASQRYDFQQLARWLLKFIFHDMLQVSLTHHHPLSQT